MGVVGSKSPLERRNTVLRRSQRKSIHGVKSKADKLTKDIKKFKGTEENTEYVELKARIEGAERELKHHSKSLQPQIKNVYAEALKKTEDCHKLLEDKLSENQEKLKETQVVKSEPKADDDGDDDVFVEEVDEEESTDKRRTVQLNLVQVEPIEASPQINKRFSAMKIGVPVMPGSLMESLQRVTQDLHVKSEERVAQIRKEIEKLEIEISQFVGRKNGKYYNKIKKLLDGYVDELNTVSTTDEDIAEQVKLCANYIASCLSFLNEKAVDDDVDGDDEDDDDYDDVMTNPSKVEDSSLSPRNIRTTYI